MSEVLELARGALADREAWLVGGAVRDRLLGRATDDLDLVLRGDVAPAARALARAAGATAFPLSERFGGWRVVARGQAWHVDLTPLHPGGLHPDLARRDLTVNAIAQPLGGGELVDPFEGRADLALGRLRMVAEGAFDDDPLRVLRVARLAAALGLDPDAATVGAARARAARLGEVAPERVFAELRLLVAGPDPRRGLELMEAVGALAEVLPELRALEGVGQGVYHHRDVLGHTLEVLDAVLALEREPERWLGPHAGAVAAYLAEPLADELTRGGALRFGALLHDIAKPRTRRSFAGKVGFPGHDTVGAEMSAAILARLRASVRLREHVAALAREHLRLGFLVHERPLARRAVYAYLRDTAPVTVDVTLLTIADRLATRGRKADEAIAKHLDLAREMLGEALTARAAPASAPLVRGDELARELGLAPGPRLGELLAAVEEARFAGEVATREEAVALARELVG